METLMRPGAVARLGGLVLLAACSGLPGNFKDPDIRPDRVILRSVSTTGGVMSLNLEVENGNRFDLRGTRLQLGLDVEGSHLGDIEYDDAFRLGRGETTSLTFPLPFNWSGVGGAMRTALGSGDLPYEMKGQVTLDTPFGKRKVAFTRAGRAPLTRSGGSMPVPAS
jgi:hypothetical protein